MFVPLEPTLNPLIFTAKRGLKDVRAAIGVSGEPGYFSMARNALWYAARLLNLKPDENVLLPAYVCEEAVLPFIHASVRVKFYNVGQDLAIDLDEVARRADERTRALLIVHYFGFGQPNISELKQWCAGRGITLIEDCAHAFLGADQAGRPLGSFGDMSVFSIRKFLPLPDGAILIMGNQIQGKAGEIGELAAPASGLMAFRTMERMVNFLSLKRGISLELIGKMARAVRGNKGAAAEDKQDAVSLADVKGMSAVSCRLVNKFNFDEIKTRRQANYDLLANHLHSIAGNCFFPQRPQGACPMVFPLRVKNRETVISRLQEKGIPAYSWPQLYRELDTGEFSPAVELSKQVLLLPIHQDLTEAHINLIAKFLLKVEEIR